VFVDAFEFLPVKVSRLVSVFPAAPFTNPVNKEAVSVSTPVVSGLKELLMKSPALRSKISGLN
jgi:hypothetical protein